MMTRFLLVVLLLAGCQPLALAPSMQHCQKVSYVRDGSTVTINATCIAPVSAQMIMNFVAEKVLELPRSY